MSDLTLEELAHQVETLKERLEELQVAFDNYKHEIKQQLRYMSNDIYDIDQKASR